MSESLQPIANDVFNEKYAKNGESRIDQQYRVASALASVESSDQQQHTESFQSALQDGFVPAGRIQSGAGTGLNVTLINCFVQPVEDSMEGIAQALREAMLTLKQGGGVGYDFSSLRPKGAWVKAVDAESSGPISFMKVFDKACETIESAGYRRGAQMGVLRIDHPDIRVFIEEKYQKGSLTNFNVSVGTTDAFMRALENDELFELVHVAEPSQKIKERGDAYYNEERGVWVYEQVRAQEIWDYVMEATYDHADPGVMYLDQINRENNLWYVERIDATNPCFTGDTKVWTDRGHIPFADLVGQQVNVLTQDHNGKLVYRLMSNIRVTKRNAELVQVRFTDGQVIRCTPNHEFFLTNGYRIQAKDLFVGQSIASVYRYKANQKGYVRLSNNFHQPLEHHIPFNGEIPDGYHVHHLNGIKNDNRPENLQIILGSVHNSQHMTGDNNPMRRFPEKNNFLNRDFSGENNGRYRNDVDTQQLIELRESGLSYRDVAAHVGCSPYTARQRIMENNHRVASVEILNYYEDVYCGTVEDYHRFFVATGYNDGVLVHNCGEQPLPNYGCCCLGSMNLPQFVKKSFTDNAQFNFKHFKEIVAQSVRMLDNVLDVTHWPLDKQHKEAMNKRRVGLGFIGLGDALIMLGLRYDSVEGRNMAKRISETMRDAAYEQSIELAKEKGAFPLLDAEQYLQSTFAQRLPEHIREGIATHGIRNSHLLSIAPTGTIALAFANNASNGIEPPFSWTYNRNKRMPDDTIETFAVEDHAFYIWRQLGNDPGEYVNGRYENLPDQFISALEMNVVDHMKMVAAIQPYVDSAISKTCNVPVDYDYQNFRQLYSDAWHAGVKGITTFRPNATTGAVLETNQPNVQKDRIEFDTTDQDRRLVLDKIPQPALASLRWKNRPTFTDGNPSRTYMVDHPQGKFALFIGFIDGERHPFEVWVNGAEQPRGVGAIAKALSMDMRTQDPAWLKTKLDSLKKVYDQPFDLTMPPNGNIQHLPSSVSAVGHLIEHACQQMSTFDQDVETPVRDALMSPKEPKTGTNGTMSWTIDILNSGTGDDFVMGLKELVMPDGQSRPYSLWMAGTYPRALDGLCKILSLDMRIIDPAWIGAKLRTLVDFPEAQGDFLAWQPGQNKQQLQPSTIAYIARLLIHRYSMLGILDDEGYPIEPMEVMYTEHAQGHQVDANVVPLRAVGATEVSPGKCCQECGNYSVVKRDGCDFCTACGAQGGCG